jgi:hypothetical protein
VGPSYCSRRFSRPDTDPSGPEPGRRIRNRYSRRVMRLHLHSIFTCGAIYLPILIPWKPLVFVRLLLSPRL